MEGVKREEERTGKRVGGICDGRWGECRGNASDCRGGLMVVGCVGFHQILACLSEAGTRKLSQD